MTTTISTATRRRDAAIIVATIMYGGTLDDAELALDEGLPARITDVLGPVRPGDQGDAARIEEFVELLVDVLGAGS
jgi:hypothetical protein